MCPVVAAGDSVKGQISSRVMSLFVTLRTSKGPIVTFGSIEIKGSRRPQVNHFMRIDLLNNFFSMARQPLLGQGFLIIEASRSHSDTPHSVGLFWASDQPPAQRPLPDNTRYSQERERETSMTSGIRIRNPNN